MKLGDLLEKLISVITFNQGKKIATFIAKLGQPLPTSATTDTTILVNIDK